MENDRASVRGMTASRRCPVILPDLFLTRQHGTAMETNGYNVRKIFQLSGWMLSEHPSYLIHS